MGYKEAFKETLKDIILITFATSIVGVIYLALAKLMHALLAAILVTIAAFITARFIERSIDNTCNCPKKIALLKELQKSFKIAGIALFIFVLFNGN